ncbi:MAG: nucleotidyltransferase domain-containing protein [Rhodospirillales bacterium]|nr:nucleotidyltransferase domain-containing protein [Rhodospirillales bacterium]MDE0381508.1 nucleotidyltransferase domain-containing protein [Rhodospirillales bacterium]
MTDGLKERHRTAVIDIIAANARVERAVLFGSRATGSFRPASDVDVALFGDRLSTSDQFDLAAAIEELTIPQRVNLLLYGTVDSIALREHIETEGIEWYRRRDTDSGDRPGRDAGPR